MYWMIKSSNFLHWYMNEINQSSSNSDKSTKNLGFLESVKLFNFVEANLD